MHKSKHIKLSEQTHWLFVFSNQNLSACLILRNWSRMMVLNSSPGPSGVVSSKPPENRSRLSGALVLPYKSFTLAIGWNTDKTTAAIVFTRRNKYEIFEKGR